MKKIYFLCTGNSCRSQMAEGYGKQLLKDWTVASAGLERHGLNPRAVQVMLEDGLDISDQTSKVIDPEYFQAAELIVTLCGDARDHCPNIPQGHQHLHWDLVDPAQVQGSEEEILAVFRQVRDKIKQNIIELMIELNKKEN